MDEVLFFRPVLPMLLMDFAGILGFLPAAPRPGPKKWLPVLAEALAILAALLALDAVIVDTGNWSTTWEPLLCFAGGFFFAAACLRTGPRAGLVFAAWAQLVTELLSQLLLPYVFRIDLAPDAAADALKLLCFLLLGGGVFALFRFLLAPRLRYHGEYLLSRRNVLVTAGVLAVFFAATNYQIIYWLLSEKPKQDIPIISVFRVFSCVCAAAVLYLQNAAEKRLLVQREFDLARQLWNQRQEQLRLSRENIELINRKCHDLKHQIAALRTLRDKTEIDGQIAEMESAVMIYDSAIKTGNDVLDVVLTEKSLFCEANGISMTCLIDGGSLGFVDKVDLYAMFGNALDNAIESVMAEPDTQKRVIQAAGWREKDLMLIRVRNYCARPPELAGELPATTKADAGYHGFGLKSIRATAEKYGGGITVETGENFFSLQILLPVPASGVGI